MISGCSYTLPERNYVLAKRMNSLMNQANYWEYSLAHAILKASQSKNLF
ncbi:hypothetical protein [Chlamydia sp. 17-3921]|nr:hypothetical protein [Chlamydia sp. 17-3921]